MKLASGGENFPYGGQGRLASVAAGDGPIAPGMRPLRAADRRRARASNSLTFVEGVLLAPEGPALSQAPGLPFGRRSAIGDVDPRQDNRYS